MTHPLPNLMYHHVAVPAARGTRFRGLTVHPSSFRRQMTWMKRLGYRGLSMRDLAPYLAGERMGKVFGITFDDGFRNVFENALPVLSGLGFTSTNYFVANQFDGGNIWDQAENVPFAPLMSVAQARAWASAGQEVGSHTLDHVHLPEISVDEARRQIGLSREILEQEIGTSVTAFCYPYGDFKSEHGLLAKEAGYANATTTNRGLANTTDDPFFLPRVGIWRTTHLLRFFQKCLTRHEDRRRV